jgi:hypothetical protein
MKELKYLQVIKESVNQKLANISKKIVIWKSI